LLVRAALKPVADALGPGVVLAAVADEDGAHGPNANATSAQPNGGLLVCRGRVRTGLLICPTLALSGRQSVCGMVRINWWPVRSKALLGTKKLATWQTS
jgi:hypothetical protein